MFYLRFTKVIINHFMSQDQSIPRRNKVDWHMANDDPIITTMRFYSLSAMNVVQKYSAFLPDNLNHSCNEKNLKISRLILLLLLLERRLLNQKYVAITPREKPDTSTLRLPLINDLSDLLKAKTQLHSSQPSGSGAYEGTCVTPGVPGVPKYGSDEEQISWKSSDEEDDDDEANIGKDEDDNDQDDDERTESDNDGDDFVHPKLSTHDDEARNDDEVNEEESNEESNDESNEESDEEVQGANTEEEEMDEEATHEEDEANELYRDVNVNLEGRDTVMTDAPLPNVQATQET
ncbi:hypothetical protein Tco_1099865 [Tanacetum coccineum]